MEVAHRSFPARRVESPQAALEHMLSGDPLRVRRVVADRLRARAVFFDARRVALATFADLAVRGEEEGVSLTTLAEGRSERRKQRLLLERAVDRTLDVFLSGAPDVALPAMAGAEDGASGRDAALDFATSLGLEHDTVRQGLTEFHRLPLATRQLFRELVIERRPLRSLAAEFDRAAVELLREVRAAFVCLLADGVEHSATPASSRSTT